MQAIGATLAVLAVVGTWALNQHDAYADERYVLKGELKAAIEGLGETLDEAQKARTILNIEKAILDLEDEIVAFDEDGVPDAAKRRCRKLTRNVRDWEAATAPQRWQVDPVVRRVCEG